MSSPIKAIDRTEGGGSSIIFSKQKHKDEVEAEKFLCLYLEINRVLF